MQIMIRTDSMRKMILAVLSLVMAQSVAAQDTLRHEVLLETSMGNVRIALYNETPLHRDNFLKHVGEGIYDGMLFHRVIADFMVQMGDTASKHAHPGQFLGETTDSLTVPAEFRFPQLFHKRGAVAAAREGDAANPERASSLLQFYIVYGIRYNDAMLDRAQARMDAATGCKVKFTPTVREAYKTLGGTPHLDGAYTVFGEVVEGLSVVEAMQAVDTDGNDRPLQDIKILKATVIK